MVKRHLHRRLNKQEIEGYHAQVNGLSSIGIMIGVNMIGWRACFCAFYSMFYDGCSTQSVITCHTEKLNLFLLPASSLSTNYLPIPCTLCTNPSCDITLKALWKSRFSTSTIILYPFHLSHSLISLSSKNPCWLCQVFQISSWYFRLTSL